MRQRASSALAPRCGVAMKLGRPSSSSSVGGSTANASTAAAAIRRAFSLSLSAVSSTMRPRAVLMSTQSGRSLSSVAAS